MPRNIQSHWIKEEDSRGMPDRIYLEEYISDGLGDTFLTRWFCEPPPKRTRYSVKRECWEGDSVRNIFEIVLIPNTEARSR